jgi:hypothetical protein
MLEDELQAMFRFPRPRTRGVALERALAFGDLRWTLLVHVAYLATMGAVGVRVAAGRLGRLLQP